MMKISKTFFAVGALIMMSGLAFGVAYASFTDQAKFTGSRFSVGSADLKLLNNLTFGTDGSNLVDSKPAPSYDGISPGWTADYLIKVYNNGSQDLELSSNMDYATANDPGAVREVLYMEPFDWNDANGDGLVTDGEQGTSYGKKAFTSWKSTGFDFGRLASGQTKALIMRFSTGSITNSKMGQTGVFDFMFDGTGI